MNSIDWPPGTVRWFRYVRHKDRTRFESEGWRVAAGLGRSHEFWAVLMEAPEGFRGAASKEWTVPDDQ